MAVGAQFAAALQALLQKLQQGQADVDFREQARRRLFAKNEMTQLDAHPMALKATNVGLADRGLTQSGIGLGQHGQVNTRHLEALEGLKSGLQNDVSGYERERLSNQTNYDMGYADIIRQDAAANATKMATTGKGFSTRPPAVMSAVKNVKQNAVGPKPAVRTVVNRPATSSASKYS